MTAMTTGSAFAVRLVLHLAGGAIFGFALYAGAHLYYESARTARYVIDLQSKLASSARLFTYGTVSTIDYGSRTMTLKVSNRYDASGQPTLLRVAFSPDTLFVRQDLVQAPDGAYEALAMEPGKTMTDLVPGTRIAVLLYSDREETRALAVYFGNPL